METAKTYAVQIYSGTAFAFLSLLSIILYTDPYTAALSTHLVFYISLFFFSSGMAIVAGMIFRRIFGKRLYILSFWDSFRQGMLIGVLTVSAMLLQTQGLLYWWVVLGLVMFLAVIELLFSS